MIVIVIVHVIVIVKKIIENVCVLLINILNFVQKIVLFKKKTTRSYFNVKYIKYFLFVAKSY